MSFSNTLILELPVTTCMQTEHRRAPRHLLGGAVEVTDLESEKQIATLSRILRPFGLWQLPLLS